MELGMIAAHFITRFLVPVHRNVGTEALSLAQTVHDHLKQQQTEAEQALASLLLYALIMICRSRLNVPV